MAAIVGLAEYAPLKPSAPWPHGATSLECCADLALTALDDAGLALAEVDGLCVVGVQESLAFVPSTVCEYLGIRANWADTVDLGGASCAGMVWRAAAMIEAGVCSVVLCLAPGLPMPEVLRPLWRHGASSDLPGSPQAEFDIPYGHLGQNALYAMVAQRYDAVHGYDPAVTARLAAHSRFNAAATPGALFEGRPVSAEEVLASRMIARPIRMLEIVAPAKGGAAIVVASAAVAARSPKRAVRVAGHGERLHHKSPENAEDLLRPPLEHAARRAFAMAGMTPADMDCAQLYDCYTINTLLSLEAAGFCGWGEGMDFLREHDTRWCGSLPVNTNGGQLGMGQAGHAGGMTHVIEAVRQIRGEAGARQVPGCDAAFVSGNGGIMSEQVALVLAGE